MDVWDEEERKEADERNYFQWASAEEEGVRGEEVLLHPMMKQTAPGVQWASAEQEDARGEEVLAVSVCRDGRDGQQPRPEAVQFRAATIGDGGMMSML